MAKTPPSIRTRSAPVPPENVAVAVPLDAPLQVTSVFASASASAGGSAIVVFSVAVTRFTSVTVTV